MDSRSVLPPMSTTSLPSSAHALEVAPASIKPPILASDILREDVAPLRPGAAVMRGWLLALVGSFSGLAIAAFEGALPGDSLALGASVIPAVSGLVAWLRPVPYGLRAGLATLAALLPLVLGAEEMGPLASIGAGGPVWAAASLISISCLPAALFFRAQYRAFRASRVFLALALVMAAPEVMILARGALAADSSLALRGADAAGVLAVLTSFAGFLGPETTGACTLWAAVLLVVLPVQQLLMSTGGDPTWTSLPVALGEAVAGTIVSLGLYQLLAAALARRARLVDVHRIVGPSAEES